MKNYVLDSEHNVIAIEDIEIWGRWFETADRIVKQEFVGNYYVSTVFLGVDHAFGGGPPLLFETMTAVDGNFLDYQTRCSTWPQAEKMHEKAVEHFRELAKRYKMIL